jgi:hypothetical protein
MTMRNPLLAALLLAAACGTSKPAPAPAPEPAPEPALKNDTVTRLMVGGREVLL